MVAISLVNSGYSQNIRVDFGTKTDPPLFKKFDQYNAGIVKPYSNYNRDLDKLYEVDAHSLRLDLSIGKSSSTFSDPQIVEGTPNNITYNFDLLDDLTMKLNERNVLPFWSWCYIPVPLQYKGNWKDLDESIPNWPEIFQDIHKEYASHFKKSGLRIGYHEIGNEPDLFGVFMDEDDYKYRYFEMYKRGALGIKAGDPDAVVGGPAFAIGEFIPGFGGFLEYVKNNNLPLDFCSFHSYLDGTSWPGEMDGIADKMDQLGLKTTDIIISEFSWLNSENGGNAGSNSAMNFYPAAVKTFEAMNVILKRTDVTFVSWAQFMESTFGDDPYGLIRKDGHRKAAFNAIKIYADMPVERNSMVISNRYLNGWASSDKHKTTMVIWNNGATEQMAEVQMENIPFTEGNFRMYRIDEDNASYFDKANENLEVVDWQDNVATKSFKWSGKIPSKGVVYLVLEDKTVPQDFFPEQYNNFFADDIRTIHYYPKRRKTYYAEFDRKRWTAYLGMGMENAAHSQVGVEAQRVPENMNVEFFKDGNIDATDKNSLLGLRIDFRENGIYTKSTLFHGGIYYPDRNAEMAWGTKLQADEVVLVNDSSFTVNFKKHAPENWDGRVIISFIMQNTGTNTRAKIIVKDPGAFTEIAPKPEIERSKFKVYPNPSANGIFYVESRTGLINSDCKITISDLQGRVCWSETLPSLAKTEIDTKGILNDGLYFLSIEENNLAALVQKIIIQKLK